MFSDQFAHILIVHKLQQSVSFAESSYPDAQESRVVHIYTNIRILRFDTTQKYTWFYNSFKYLTYLVSIIIHFT